MPASLLIGLDGSRLATAATQLGIRWASLYGAVLKGIAIVDEPTICAPGPVPLGGGAAKKAREQSQLSEAHHRADQLLEAFERECQQAKKVLYQTGKKVGQPEHQLLLESQAHDAVLLGKETFFHYITQEEKDETATYLVKNAPRPVLLVGERIPVAGTVVVAWDGSVQAARALSSFITLKMHRTSEVHVITIDSDHLRAGETIDRAMRYLAHHEVTAHREMQITKHDPADLILSKLAEWKAELLVMGAYGKSSIMEFFFGSVTREVLKESPIPILLDH